LVVDETKEEFQGMRGAIRPMSALLR